MMTSNNWLESFRVSRMIRHCQNVAVLPTGVGLSNRTFIKSQPICSIEIAGTMLQTTIIALACEPKKSQNMICVRAHFLNSRKKTRQIVPIRYMVLFHVCYDTSRNQFSHEKVHPHDFFQCLVEHFTPIILDWKSVFFFNLTHYVVLLFFQKLYFWLLTPPNLTEHNPDHKP